MQIGSGEKRYLTSSQNPRTLVRGVAQNIRVMALLPSLTDTDMVRELQWFRWVVPMTPEQVAQALVVGLHKESPEILVGWQSHLAVWCHRIAPMLLEKVLLMAAPLSKDERKRYQRLRPARTTSP